MSDTIRHPDTERLQELAGDRLDAADTAVVESHLAGCERCREEVEEWRALYLALGGLPSFEPSVGFADAVMARVEVPSPWAVRLAALYRRLVPRTTGGWALATAFLALPALVYAGAVAWLADQPWFSLGWLVVFAREQVWGFVRNAAAAGADWVLGTDVARALADAAATAPPGSFGLMAALFGTAMVVSAWVLYHHLIQTPSRESGHATLAF